jgi:hypothetical protein
VLAAVWDYCAAHALAFKFLRGRRVMMTRNSKYAGRGSSGKLVTIYPVDEAQLELVLKERSPGQWPSCSSRWRSAVPSTP